ncbi:MAG: hypothetical protein HY235_04290, partial [Acidobacteria bacterium]|nr:hypothetical protein [Acidobacteriota bacterium]
MSNQDAWDTYAGGYGKGGELEWASKEAYQRFVELTRQGEKSVLTAAAAGFAEAWTSGEVRDSLYGFTDKAVHTVTGGLVDLNLDRFVEHPEAYSQGAVIGQITGLTVNAVLTVASAGAAAQGVVKAVQFFQAGGRMLQVGTL